jgi:hypothetical protein
VGALGQPQLPPPPPPQEHEVPGAHHRDSVSRRWSTSRRLLTWRTVGAPSTGPLPVVGDALQRHARGDSSWPSLSVVHQISDAAIIPAAGEHITAIPSTSSLSFPRLSWTLGRLVGRWFEWPRAPVRHARRRPQHFANRSLEDICLSDYVSCYFILQLEFPCALLVAPIFNLLDYP